MSRFGLRTLLLVPLLATLVIGVALLGVYTYTSVKADQIDTLDDELTRVLQISVDRDRGVRRPIPGDPPGDAGELALTPLQAEAGDDDVEADGPLQFVLDPSGNVVSVAPATGYDLSPLLGGSAPVRIDGDPAVRAVSEVSPTGNTIVVALPLDEIDSSLSSLRQALMLGGLALLVTQAIIATFVVSAVKRPISLLRERAHRVACGALQTPLDVAGGPSEVVSLTDDIGAMVSQLRSTIDERERAAESANRARNDMARFMADVSHELRTPLTAIGGYHDLYANGMLDDDGTDKAMERIGAESDRLGDLVNDLLRLLRPTDPKTFEVVDLGAIASAVVHDLRAATGSHSLSISLADESLETLGDAARIHQAILNLAANACHHTPDGTKIDVAVRVDAETDMLVVDVVDDGPGFDPALVADVVKPFVRLDESRTRDDKGGAGLGLSITMRIAEQHDGHFDISSEPDVGTTQSLRLPRISTGSVENNSPP